MLCFSELAPKLDYSKWKEFLPDFDKLKEGDYGPRRVTQAEIKELFQDGWRINYIRQATMESRMRPGVRLGWLSSISKE